MSDMKDNIEKIIKVLKTERECIKRQEGIKCPRNVNPERGCYGCDLIQYDANEILKVYDFLIGGYELLLNEGAEEYTLRVGKRGNDNE